MESLIAVVVLEAEVSDELMAELSSAVSERQVMAMSRSTGLGVAFVGPPLPSLEEALWLVGWVIDVAGRHGLTDALVVEACAFPATEMPDRLLAPEKQG